MTKAKCLIIILLTSLVILFTPKIVNAADKYTATSTINGVTVNWEYELNGSNQIENLKCTNASELTGNITIPATIDNKEIISIGGYAFRDAINITEVTIPASVEKIGINAFEDCTSLTKVSLPDGLKEFGWNVFKGCTGLTEFTIPKNVTSAQTIFKGCTNLTKVTFEDGIKEIPAYVCSGVNGITEITIPASVEKIGINAFENCTNLKKITILDNVKDMGWGMAQSDDTVFINHNSDLTIYCYEDSMAAKYAIKYNIKHVYLTKTPSDTSNPNTQNDEEKNPDASKSDTSNPDTKSPTSQNTEKKDDKTISTGKLPDTGIGLGIIIAMVSVIVVFVFVFIKFRNLKDIH